MTIRRIVLSTLAAAFVVLGVLPAIGSAGGELEQAGGQAGQTVEQVIQAVDQAVQPVQQGVEQAVQPVQQGVQGIAPAPGGQTRQQAPAGDPQLQPPLNGTNPHGQGGVAATDLAPDPARPQGSDTAGSDTGEEVVVGRARGEQQADGSYSGRITILALLGEEIVGVDTAPGETEAGPLDALQEAVLDPLCDGSGEQVCLEVLAADSATTEDGSMNRFAVARAQVGGPEAISVGAAESQGNIGDDGTCQTSSGSSSVADANLAGTTADAAQSESSTQACNDARGTTTQSDSRVINLSEAGIPLPAPGCDTGEETQIDLLLVSIVCNATDTGTDFSVREALDVFVLPVGDSSLTRLSTAEAESLAVAPPAVTPPPVTPPVTPPTPPDDGGDDGGDDDGGDDGDDDAGDDDGDAGDDDGGDGGDAGIVRTSTGGDGAGAECSDGIDNDGDGRVDFPDDPQCDSAQDDSESDDARAASLPFSGANVLGLALAGLLALAGGLLLRRRGELPGTP